MELGKSPVPSVCGIEPHMIGSTRLHYAADIHAPNAFTDIKSTANIGDAYIISP